MNLLMLTTARTRMADPWAYCNATIAAIQGQDLGGVSTIGIVSDGEYGGVQPQGWVLNDQPKAAAPGNRAAFWRLLKLGAAMGGDLLAIEDDVIFAPEAIAKIAALAVPPGAGWVQFFRPLRYRTPMPTPGIWPRPRGSHLFNQALKFSADAIAALAEHEPSTSDIGADAALAHVAASLGIDYCRHVPDLVQHIGAVSQFHPTVNSIDGRTAESFAGGAP